LHIQGLVFFAAQASLSLPLLSLRAHVKQECHRLVVVYLFGAPLVFALGTVMGHAVLVMCCLRCLAPSRDCLSAVSKVPCDSSLCLLFYHMSLQHSMQCWRVASCARHRQCSGA
jgi:hypothetical protein